MRGMKDFPPRAVRRNAARKTGALSQWRLRKRHRIAYRVLADVESDGEEIFETHHTEVVL